MSLDGYINEIARTQAIPDYGMSEVPWAKHTYFTESVPGQVYRACSPDDPRAQLGWLDHRIDKVKGVLSQLEAWRKQIVVPPPVVKPKSDFEPLPYKPRFEELFVCTKCWSHVLAENLFNHTVWHRSQK